MVKVATGKLRWFSFYGFDFLIKIGRDVVCPDGRALGLGGLGSLKRAVEIGSVLEESGRDGLQCTSKRFFDLWH